MMRTPVTLAALALLAPLGSPQATLYEVTVVLPDPAAIITGVFEINDFGWFAGNTIVGGVSTAFVSDGTTTHFLPPVSGSTNSAASGVLFEQVALVNSTAPFQVPAVWFPSGSMHSLQPLAGDFGAQAAGGNSFGMVVGRSVGNNTDSRPVVWRRSRAPEALDVPPGFGVNAGANAINDAGTIVGSSGSAPQTGFVIDKTGTFTLVPEGALLDVNAANVAVGFGGPPQLPIIYANGSATIAPLPPGSSGGGLNAINDAGLAVGGSSAGPFRTDGSTAVELNTLLDPVTGAGVTVTGALDINNLGQICGRALTASGQVGVVLTPMAGG